MPPHWACTAVERGNALFLERGRDANATTFHVHYVGLDTTLDYSRWEIDAFGREKLDERFGNDTAAAVAASWAAAREILVLINVDVDTDASPFGNIQQKIAKNGTGWSAANNGHSGIVLEFEVGCRSFHTGIVSCLYVIRKNVFPQQRVGKPLTRLRCVDRPSTATLGAP